MKKILALVLALAMILSFTSCGKNAKEPTGTDGFHIGIVTSPQALDSESYGGAMAFQSLYGSEKIIVTQLPEDFAEDSNAVVSAVLGFADDEEIKAVIVNQAVSGTAEAFKKLKEKRPDILCIAADTHEDISKIASAADLVCTDDFISRGYLIAKTAHEMGCDTLVHISCERHLGLDAISKKFAIMKSACKSFGIEFVSEIAPDPLQEGIETAQDYILENVSDWVARYGINTAFYCTADELCEPLIKKLLTVGGYYIEGDIPSPGIGFPGALEISINSIESNPSECLSAVEKALCEKGGADRFATWVVSLGYSLSAGLAQHAMNVISGKSELTNAEDIAEAFAVFSSGAEWSGAAYFDSEADVTLPNVLLVNQDTYVLGDPGHYINTTSVEVPEKYFNIK